MRSRVVVAVAFLVVASVGLSFKRTASATERAQIQIASTAPPALTALALTRASSSQFATVHFGLTARANATERALSKPGMTTVPPKPTQATDRTRAPRYIGRVALGLVVLLVGALSKWRHDRKIARHSQKLREELARKEGSKHANPYL